MHPCLPPGKRQTPMTTRLLCAKNQSARALGIFHRQDHSPAVRRSILTLGSGGDAVGGEAQGGCACCAGRGEGVGGRATLPAVRVEKEGISYEMACFKVSGGGII